MPTFRIPRTLEEAVDREEMALLVYDMQVGIVRQLADGARVMERVQRVLSAARDAGMRVFFTRHMSLPQELMGASQYRMAMTWQKVDRPEQVKPWFLRDSPGFALAPELQPRASEAIFDKLAMSAFEGTPLEFALRDCGVVAVALVGIALEIGIEPTARHAADLGFLPVVVEDACGAGHPDAAARSIESLRFAGDTLFSDVETFCRLLATGPGSRPR
ncbi:MAG TPA: cysteine hydrolase [Myxococcaceae bacterium]|nr:cysteine hydrolase [Myxococcaceae bacterium]